MNEQNSNWTRVIPIGKLGVSIGKFTCHNRPDISALITVVVYDVQVQKFWWQTECSHTFAAPS